MKKIKKLGIIGGLAISCLTLSAFALFGGVQASAEEEARVFSLSAKGNSVQVTLPQEATGYLLRFRNYEYHSSTDFLPLYDGEGDDNKADGYETDRNYYDLNAGGVVEAVVEGENLVIDRYVTKGEEKGRDKIYDKFYVVSGGDIVTVEGIDYLYGGEVVCEAQYVTEFDARRNYANEGAVSIKGLEVVNYDDAEELGISQGMKGLDINTIITGKNAKDAIPYTFNGKTYYYSANELASSDKEILGMTRAGIDVTMSFLIYGSQLGTLSVLGHPDFEPIPNFPMCISAANVTNDISSETFAATCSFLADRYTREDKLYGHVSNFIVGNEVESACQWNNMGYLPLDEYVRQYERAVRIAYTAIKSVWANANVLLCCSHFWNVDVATQYLNYDAASYEPFIGHGSFTSRGILTEFAKVAKQYGDYDWKLAYHPYRANAIGESIFWDQVNQAASAHDEEKAAKVTPLNIDVLASFLQKPSIAYNGKAREYYVTEYGSGTPHGTLNAADYDPDLISEQVLNEQAASYIYSYYMLYFNGAKSYMLHRHVDAYGEQGENLGIWLRQKGSDALYKKKPLWEVMKYIDTAQSLKYTNKYLQYIKPYPTNTAPKSWAEIIPNFDARKLERAPIKEERSLQVVESYQNTKNWGFEDGSYGAWKASDATTDMTVLQDSSVACGGNAALIAQYESVAGSGKGLAKKGLRYEYNVPEDLTKYERFNFAMKIEQPDDTTTHFVSVRFYSGDHVIEYKTTATAGEYAKYSLPISQNDWKYFSKVDRIKIWYCSENLEAPSGNLYFDDVGFTGGRTEEGCNGSLSFAAMPLLPMLVGVVVAGNKKVFKKKGNV